MSDPVVPPIDVEDKAAFQTVVADFIKLGRSDDECEDFFLDHGLEEVRDALVSLKHNLEAQFSARRAVYIQEGKDGRENYVRWKKGASFFRSRIEHMMTLGKKLAREQGETRADQVDDRWGRLFETLARIEQKIDGLYEDLD